MKTLKPISVTTFAVNYYGTEHQKKKAIEEMAELITELSREQDGRTNPNKIITEIADVLIMTRQLAVVYGYDAVMAEVQEKELRLLHRINEESECDIHNTENQNGNG